MQWNLPLKLPGLIKTIFKYADTDLSANEVLKLAYWVTKLDSNGIKRAQITGPTGAMNGSFYILPTDEALAASVEDFFTPPAEIADTTGTSEITTPSTTASLTSADLGGAAVDVVNSTGRAGQAALAGLWLERQGAALGTLTTSELPVAGTGVVQYPSARLEAAAQSVADALGIQRVEKNADVDRVTVVLCEDYAVAEDALAAASAEPLRSGRVAGPAEAGGHRPDGSLVHALRLQLLVRPQLRPRHRGRHRARGARGLSVQERRPLRGSQRDHLDGRASGRTGRGSARPAASPTRWSAPRTSPITSGGSRMASSTGSPTPSSPISHGRNWSLSPFPR